MATKKFILAEKDIPQAWYNVIADMPNKPMSPFNPATKSPQAVEDLYPIFAEELCKQELNTSDAWIEIPEEVRDMYKIWRPTPLVRALGLEKALDTPAHIYFKNESVSPVGSHKLNSAIPQAYYCKKQGITNITTETGAGQWGAALSLAAKAFGLELAVYMVKVSFHQKPYRRSIMQTFGAQVIASPSMSTKAGRKILTDHPNYQGSLGTAISEAIELAMSTPNCKYTLGSVLNHVSLHQTVIGLEAEKQMEMAGEYPDIVIACFGGGSTSTAHVHFGTYLLPGQYTCRWTTLPRSRDDRQPTEKRWPLGSRGHRTTRYIQSSYIIRSMRRNYPCPGIFSCNSRHYTRSIKSKRRGKRKMHPLQSIRPRAHRYGCL